MPDWGRLIHIIILVGVKSFLKQVWPWCSYNIIYRPWYKLVTHLGLVSICFTPPCVRTLSSLEMDDTSNLHILLKWLEMISICAILYIYQSPANIDPHAMQLISWQRVVQIVTLSSLFCSKCAGVNNLPFLLRVHTCGFLQGA